MLFCICSQNPCMSIVRRGQLLNVIFNFLSAKCIRWPGVALIRVSCRCVIDVELLGFVCCTSDANADSNHCLFSELPSASTRVRHTQAAAAAHPCLKYQGVRCPNLQGVYCRPGSNVE